MNVTSRSVEIPAAGVVLEGDIDVPEAARGVVVFVHGSGSSRHSPRNRYVAGELEKAGLATVLAAPTVAQQSPSSSQTPSSMSGGSQMNGSQTNGQHR